MVDVNKDTATTDTTIQGIVLQAPEPFVEGHVLTAPEAKVLNQTYKENLRNNFAASVKKAIEEAGDADGVDVDTLQEVFDDYIAGYEFGIRRTGGGGGGSRRLDPIEKEAMAIARQMVRNGIKAKGYKVSDVPAAKITELAADLIEANPAITELARTNVARLQDIAQGELDLGDLGVMTEEVTEEDAV